YLDMSIEPSSNKRRNGHLALTVLDLSGSLDLPLDLAPRADELGYSRYWLTEHFESMSPHGCSVLYAAMIAGLTTSIRVGTAGILLRYYPAVLAAMQFRLAAALFSDRFDAGFCGGLSPQSKLLEEDLLDVSGSYPSKVERLVRYTREDGSNA